MPEACVSAGCALEPVLAAASAPAVWPASAGCMAGWPGPAEAAPPFEPVGTENATGAGTGVESDADESGWPAGEAASWACAPLCPADGLDAGVAACTTA